MQQTLSCCVGVELIFLSAPLSSSSHPLLSHRPEAEHRTFDSVVFVNTYILWVNVAAQQQSC